MSHPCKAFSIAFASLIAVSLLPLGSSSNSSALQAGEGKETKPVWSADLSADSSYVESVSAGLLHGAQIAFIANNTLALFFPVARANEDCKACKVTLVCLVLDTDTGKLEKKATWSTPFKPNVGVGKRWVTPTISGEFLVYTGMKLLRYGPGFELLQERPILDPVRTSFVVSPKRTLLLSSDFIRTGRFRETIVNTRDLTNETVFGEGMGSVGVDDDGDVLRLSLNWTERTKPLPGCEEPLADWKSGSKNKTCGGPVRVYEKPSAYICAPQRTCRIVFRGAREATLIDDDTILLDTGLNHLTLVSRSGETLYKGTLSSESHEQLMRSISSDLAARRFSFRSGHLTLNMLTENATWVERVHVFDLDALKPVLTITFEKKGDTPFRSFEQAISPDGTRLAVLENSELHLYQLP